MSTEMKRNRSIMIIDDEVGIGETIAEHLKDIYEKVDFYSDPVEAQKALMWQEYSLILSDINMPKLLGPDLIRFVRAEGILSPVIFLTGFANKENVLAALRLGVADIIEKPFGFEELTKSMERIFEIEKRKVQLILDSHSREIAGGKFDKQRKMLGLLQVVQEKKKAV